MSRKDLNRYDFSGEFDPRKNHNYSFKTFSVGIFKWIPKASGKGLKKSAVVYRVKGNVSDANKVYAMANKICDLLDKGESIPGMSTTV